MPLLLTVAAFLAAQTRTIVPAPIPASAPAASRLRALLIGNKDYNRQPLVNPINDSEGLARLLQEVGFETTIIANARRVELEQSVQTFTATVQPGDVALFFFSGHGMEVGGENYLIPIDFDAQSEVEVKYKALAASMVQDLLHSRGARVTILILDACRDNPYRTWKSNAGGLARMSGAGVYVAFAAAPGRTADDLPSQRNGLFTKHLLTALRAPGLTIDQVFNRVRQGVDQESAGAQLPFSNSGLIGEFYFRAPAAEAERAIAELQREETELQGQVEAARLRESQQKQRSQQEKAASDRQRGEWQRRLDEISRERQIREAERQRALDEERRQLTDEAAKQQVELARLRTETELRVRDLREKVRTQTQEIGAVPIDEARVKVAGHRAKIEELQRAIGAERDKELTQIDKQYSLLFQATTSSVVKDMFETTSDFEARRQKQQQELARLRQQQDTSKEEVRRRYDTEIEAQAKPYRDQIADLTGRLYSKEPVLATWRAYDADANALTVSAGAVAFVFDVPPEKARELFLIKDQLKVEPQYGYSEADTTPTPKSVTLIDPLGGRFKTVELRAKNIPPPSGPAASNGASVAALAARRFQGSQFAEFESLASEALSAGDSISLILQHHHSLSQVHRVRVFVSRTAIRFEVDARGLAAPGTAANADLPPASCNITSLSGQVQRIVSAKVTTNKQSEVFLNIKIRDSQNTQKVEEVNLADEFSTKERSIQKSAGGMVGVVRRTVRSRPEAVAALTAIQHVIEHAQKLSLANSAKSTLKATKLARLY